GGAGEAAGHADQGDRGVVVGSSHCVLPLLSMLRRWAMRERCCSRASPESAPASCPARAASASEAMVGAWSRRCGGRYDSSSAFLTSAMLSMPSSELPPSSKKLSCTPTCSRPSASDQTPAIVSSSGVCGSTYAVDRSGRGCRPKASLIFLTVAWWLSMEDLRL